MKAAAVLLVSILVFVAFPVGILAWFVAGWAGAGGDARLLVATQVPVFAVLMLWLAALIAGPGETS